MGVSDLMNLIRTKYPECLDKVHISNYAYKKIAIDTSSFLFRYKSVLQDNWMNGFIEMIRVFRKNHVHCVFVFDGRAGNEKDKEKEKRREKKNDLVERITKLELAIQDYHENGVVNDDLKEFQKRRKIQNTVNLFDKSGSFNIQEVEYAVSKLKTQVINIKSEDYDNLKKLFELFSVPYLQAVKEAETLCCDLFIQGKVSAVCSEDSDVLCYGADKLGGFNSKEESFTLVSYKNLLEHMGLTSDQFLDFCIMCGLDYNERIPSIGPINSLKLIKQHKNIDKIHEETKLDIACLDHINMRELFRNYDKFSGKVSYCDQPDWIKLQEFFFIKNIKQNLVYIRKSFDYKLQVEE